MTASRTMFVGCVLGALCASLLTKFAADAWLRDSPLLWEWQGMPLGLRYALNPGIAFGLRLPHMLQTPLILCALVAIGVFALRSIHGTWGNAGFGLIIGGAIGNVLDRLPDGFVTDMFQVGSFPIFNVADSCITVGVCFLLMETAFAKKLND